MTRSTHPQTPVFRATGQPELPHLVRPSPCLPRQGTARIWVGALDDPESPFATMFCGPPVRLCGSTVPLQTRTRGVPRSRCLCHRLGGPWYTVHGLKTPSWRAAAKIVTCARNTGGSLACCSPTDTGLATWGRVVLGTLRGLGWTRMDSGTEPFGPGKGTRARGHDFPETTRNGRDGAVTTTRCLIVERGVGPVDLSPIALFSAQWTANALRFSPQSAAERGAR